MAGLSTGFSEARMKDLFSEIGDPMAKVDDFFDNPDG
jgi:hypothetical protein